MIITTQYTPEYAGKAAALSASLDQHWSGARALVEVGNRANVATFRKDWPRNRANYCCPQAGEFVDWIECPEDEIIICVDADTVMMRPFTPDELYRIARQLESSDVLAVLNAYPPSTLRQVLYGYPGTELRDGKQKPRTTLGCTVPFNEACDLFPAFEKWQGEPEFTASFLVARKRDFRRLATHYVRLFDNMTRLTGHHAGGQWLVNYVCREYLAVAILPPVYQCAPWYGGGAPHMHNVIFHHTK